MPNSPLCRGLELAIGASVTTIGQSMQATLSEIKAALEPHAQAAADAAAVSALDVQVPNLASLATTAQSLSGTLPAAVAVLPSAVSSSGTPAAPPAAPPTLSGDLPDNALSGTSAPAPGSSSPADGAPAGAAPTASDTSQSALGGPGTVSTP